MTCLMPVFIAPLLGLHAFKLNDMGYGLNRISPITFDEDAFQTPNNETQGRAPMSTPRKTSKQSGSWEDQQATSENRTYLQKQTSKQDDQVRSKSYNADTSVRNAGHFIPPGQSNPSDNNLSNFEIDFNQTVFQGHTQQRSVSTSIGMSQPSNTVPAPTGTTGATQTSPRRDTQVGGTQTSPPPQPKKHTSLGGTQTTPP